MTTPPTSPPTSPQAPPPRIESEDSWWQHWGLRLLPALTFLVGIVLGAVVVIAGQPGATVGEVTGEPSPSPSASSDPDAVGDTVVTLPAACEDAAENVTEATRLIDESATAVRDFRPDELVGLLNQLEDLDAETRELAAECRRVQVSESALPEQTDGPTDAPTDGPTDGPADGPSAEPSAPE